MTSEWRDLGGAVRSAPAGEPDHAGPGRRGHAPDATGAIGRARAPITRRRPARFGVRRLLRPVVALGVAAGAMVTAAGPAAAGPLSLVVTTTADSGPGSLRQAITDADKVAAGTDVNVTFPIPGSRPFTIKVFSPLPVITRPVTIDATGRELTPGTPVVEITPGLNVQAANGLTVGGGATGTSIKGLIIDGFGAAGIRIGAINVTVTGCWIGLDPSGNANGNTTGIAIGPDITGATIGGPGTDANTISGNAERGVAESVGASGNIIKGNFIGTDPTGTTATGPGGRPLGNGTGVVLNGNDDLVGAGPGDPATAGNVISGNSGDGVIVGGMADAVSGNYIGTNAAGDTALGNGGGVAVYGQKATIGGWSPALGNLISGNRREGVAVEGAAGVATLAVLQYNTIGLNRSGSSGVGADGSPLGNLYGVVLGRDSNRTTVSLNTISANSVWGVEVLSRGGFNTMVGNTIGSTAGDAIQDANGRPTGNGFGGIRIGGSPNNSATLNFVSGNLGRGVLLEGQGSTANAISQNLVTSNRGAGIEEINGVSGTTDTANRVSANSGPGIRLDDSHGDLLLQDRIGTDTVGDALGNGGPGILAEWGTTDITIGGLGTLGNTIANNGGGGIVIGNRPADTTTERVQIVANSIHDNTALGIDLGNDGVTPNGTNPREFPNRGQNYPLLTGAEWGGTSGPTVHGELSSAPNTVYNVQVYANSTQDPSGHGQGRYYLGAFQVLTDASGHAYFDNQVPNPPAAATDLATTATDPSGNTSEFSTTVTPTGTPPNLAPTAEFGSVPTTPTSASLFANVTPGSDPVTGFTLTTGTGAVLAGVTAPGFTCTLDTATNLWTCLSSDPAGDTTPFQVTATETATTATATTDTLTVTTAAGSFPFLATVIL